MDEDEVAVGSRAALKLFSFLLRAVGLALLAASLAVLLWGRNVNGASDFLVAAAGIAAFVSGLLVLAFTEIVSLMIDLAHNQAIAAAASQQTVQKLSRMMGETRPGDRIEPRLF